MSHESLEREDVVKGPSNRSFGFVFAVVFLVIGLLPLIGGHRVLIWSLATGAAFGVVALVAPAVLTPLNRIWLKFGLLLHKIVSPIVLGILFFVVITPMGLAMRLFGKDPLRLRLDRGTKSYWIERVPPGPAPETLKDQF
jgi:saxitoxin biosynthesis operon SxtJ-like protein